MKRKLLATAVMATIAWPGEQAGCIIERAPCPVMRLPSF